MLLKCPEKEIKQILPESTNHNNFMVFFAGIAKKNLKNLAQLFHRGTQRRFPPKYIKNTF